jgi:hypothetical protein
MLDNNDNSANKYSRETSEISEHTLFNNGSSESFYVSVGSILYMAIFIVILSIRTVEMIRHSVGVSTQNSRESEASCLSLFYGGNVGSYLPKLCTHVKSRDLHPFL